MSNKQNRRPSFSSSTMSSLAKRHAPSRHESVGKPAATTVVPATRLAKKRAPLSNITNQKNGSWIPISSSYSAYCSNKSAKLKEAPTQPDGLTADMCRTGPQPVTKPTSMVVSEKITSLSCWDDSVSSPAPVSLNQYELTASSPVQSQDSSVSMDESMSTDSLKSPQVEYIDNDEMPTVGSIERKAMSNLYITESSQTSGATSVSSFCCRDALSDMEVNIDGNYEDPQLCATLACDIYKHLRASEAKKRPAVDYIERIQKDINSSMRGILVDWLVEVAEEYRLVPDTLYLTVNYIDRYLSGNEMSRQKLQLLGVTCMMIAAKYEEICAPQVEEFCYITDNTYFKEELLEMESSVLNFLKFEMTAPTPKCFLRRFVRAAQGITEAPSMQLECMANYITELSLLEYTMLSHSPSLIAASAIFLAKYILDPTKRPWNSTLKCYTLYEASELRTCVKDLLGLCRDAQTSSLPAVRDKYSQHKYKLVARKFFPAIIPLEFFHDN